MDNDLFANAGSIRKVLPLNQPQTHKCVTTLHKSKRIYMGVIILGVNTLYINFCLEQMPMASKGLLSVLPHSGS